jgi:GT2 family glycosyltransferase
MESPMAQAWKPEGVGFGSTRPKFKIKLFEKNMNKLNPKFVFIVLNYNGWPDTIECLESIFHNNYDNYNVVVVDNCSKDDSVKNIISWADGKLDCWINPSNPLKDLSFPPINKPVKHELLFNSSEQLKAENSELIVIQNKNNGGFAKGNNIGVKFANKLKPDFICIVNNDTVVGSDFIQNFIEEFTNAPKEIGVLGPCILDYKDFSDWQRPTMVEQSLWSIIPKLIAYKLKRRYKIDNYFFSKFWYTGNTAKKVNTLHGSCLIFRISAFNKVNGFDENTFLYFEEDIISIRLKELQLQEMYIPMIKIYHKWGQSIGSFGFIHLVRSSIYFYKKYKNASFLGLTYLRIWYFTLFCFKFLIFKHFRNMKTTREFIRVLFN